MASSLSPEDRAFFETLLAKAEPYDAQAPEADTFDGSCDIDKLLALTAKEFLDGKL